VQGGIPGHIQKDLTIPGACYRAHRDVVIGGKEEALLDDEVTWLHLGDGTDFPAVTTKNVITDTDLARLC